MSEEFNISLGYLDEAIYAQNFFPWELILLIYAIHSEVDIDYEEKTIN
jgi:hypothetical protein